MRNFTAALCILAVLIGVFCFPVFDAFVFTETRTEQPDFRYIRQAERDEFVIRYIHSIHLSDVIETYKVTDDQRIRFIKMEYEDLAIGLPGSAEEGETFTEKQGKYTLGFEDKVLDSFNLFIGDIDTALELRHGGRTYDLKELLERGTSYEFKVKKLSLFELLKGVEMNGG